MLAYFHSPFACDGLIVTVVVDRGQFIDDVNLLQRTQLITYDYVIY